jgi:hypothetical protein
MDPEIPAKARQDPHANRARAIILVLMAVFIAVPFVVWLLVDRSAGGRP